MFYKTVTLETVLVWLLGDRQAADSKQIESFYGPKKKSQTPAPDPHAPLGDGPCLSFEHHLVFYSSCP